MLFIATRYNYAKGLDGLYPRCSIFRSPRCIQECVAAAESGNLEVLKFVMNITMKRYPTRDLIYYELDLVLRAVIKVGNVECLKYALQRSGNGVTREMVIDTVSRGHIDYLKLIFTGDIKNIDKDLCDAAASNGHLDCLKFLRSTGCKCYSSTCNAAASNGHLACLEYACNEGCPRDDNTCAAAASGGHIAVLKWLIENGCPCDPVVSDAINKVKPEHPAKKMKVEA